jgi:WD40 repeat protein
MMITVGDDNRVLLFSISYSGNYELIQTMAVSNDANFSIAWNHTSDKFAVSSQDGSVHIWDIRHSNPIAKFTGINSSITKGAARCVKFTQAGAIDLLAFTEHVSHVHVIDARTFDGQQTLRIGSNRYDTPITGLSFSVDSKNMFVGKYIHLYCYKMILNIKIGLENSILDFNIDTGIRRRFPGGLLI